MGYYVSRQKVWPSGEPIVEIAWCLDAAGPDMLVPYFRGAGEGGTYDDPREAAAAAIRVRDLWWADGKNPCFEDWDGVLINDFATDVDLLAWADKKFDALPKCVNCGTPTFGRVWYAADCEGESEFGCCSERCAEVHAAEVDDG